MTRIAILDDYQDAARRFANWSRLPAGVTMEVFRDHLHDEAQVARRLRGFEIVMAMRERTPFPASLLGQLPALRLLATTGMWNAAIDLEAATAHGIVVCGTKGGNHATMELTWGLLLALLRHIPAEDASIRAGGWQTSVGRLLQGKTIGLLGLGNIGGQMARVARAFDMRVMAWSHNLTEARAMECDAERVNQETLLSAADIVSIHLRLSERTQGLLGRVELMRMKPGAVLINTSRGPIVNERALAEVLRAGHLSGAAVDVFDQEPLAADHPYRGVNNLLLTPHVGYVTAETYETFFGQTLENILAYLQGQPTRVMNEAVLAKRRPRP
ncbi:MAG: D-2-hydroxyacid dehydrogenase family protein [Candidatus Lambdaproteobacteria bacterium]|nr:D-2-hydroxyacid dehydrogenase family protein [Candidatus Lambdaproteobacteria bacterium]